MIYMVGECTGRRVAMLEEAGVGRMWIARGRHIYTYPGERWGFDNGAFRDWVAGDDFDADAYAVSLERALAHPHPPYLAVLPDIPAQGKASAEMSMRWLDRLGPVLPWYLAVQDGMDTDDVEPFVGRISGVFLGGSSAFKASAQMWADYAHERGMKMHYARCGTPEKLAHAMHVGADSADSALAMWTEQRWCALMDTLEHGPAQRDLFRGAA